MCMLGVGAGGESSRTRWQSLVPKHLQMTEWIREEVSAVLREVGDFASFKLVARPRL
jgi:hypothetical protein